MKEIVPSKNNIVPPLSKETVIIVENIQNVTQCSEAEAVQTLFECNMDPHEAVLLILEKGSFQEVKYKQKRKKEMRDDDCIKNATGLRSPYSCRTSTLKDAAGLHSPFPTRTSSLTRGCGGGFIFYQSTSPISPFLRDPGPQKTNPLLFAQPEFAPAKNLYPCFACLEFGSFTLDALKVHNKKDHPLCKDKCNLCYNVFDTNKALLAHKKSMSHGFKNKIKIFLCVHCGSKNKTYTTMRKLRTHTWAKHGRFNYRCKLCRNLFETGRAVSVHKPSCVCAHGQNVTEEDGGSDFSEIDENVEESGEEEDEE